MVRTVSRVTTADALQVGLCLQNAHLTLSQGMIGAGHCADGVISGEVTLIPLMEVTAESLPAPPPLLPHLWAAIAR